MTKTAAEVVQDLRARIIDSPLARELSGEVYLQGLRPRDSRKEDLVIIFTAGTAEQVQSGFVTLNIFVPDIDARADGTLVQDGQRTATIERKAQEWASTLSAAHNGYLWRLQGIIATYPDADIKQHFVSVRLYFRHFEE